MRPSPWPGIAYSLKHGAQGRRIGIILHNEEIKELALSLRSDADVLKARRYGATLGDQLGFSNNERAMLSIAISEIARNTVLYARNGFMYMTLVQDGLRRGLRIVVEDDGPGIPDIELAMRDGYTTSKGLGVGLPGARRLMDDFDIVSEAGKGTTITMTKWEQ